MSSGPAQCRRGAIRLQKLMLSFYVTWQMGTWQHVNNGLPELV